MLLCIKIIWFILGTCGISESKNTLCQFYVIVQVWEKDQFGGRQTCVHLPALSKVVLLDVGELPLGAGAKIKFENAYLKYTSGALNKWYPYPNLFTLKK